MNEVPDQARRDLERRALLNAGLLAEKLGYRDFLDRRKEKAIVLLVGGLVLALVTAVALSVVMKARQDERDIARRRCAVEFQASPYRLEEVRAEIRKTRPDLTPRQRAGAVLDRLDELAAKCMAE